MTAEYRVLESRPDSRRERLNFFLLATVATLEEAMALAQARADATDRETYVGEDSAPWIHTIKPTVLRTISKKGVDE